MKISILLVIVSLCAGCEVPGSTSKEESYNYNVEGDLISIQNSDGTVENIGNIKEEVAE